MYGYHLRLSALILTGYNGEGPRGLRMDPWGTPSVAVAGDWAGGGMVAGSMAAGSRVGAAGAAWQPPRSGVIRRQLGGGRLNHQRSNRLLESRRLTSRNHDQKPWDGPVKKTEISKEIYMIHYFLILLFLKHPIIIYFLLFV